jgi:plasmid stabilization system protein ParE
MVRKRKISWDENARDSLFELYKYIRADSLTNALKVKKEILASVKVLSTYPEIHPPDKFKQLNDGNFRAYEKHHYRISYHASKFKLSF